MPNISEWTREAEDREADVHQPHHCNGTAHASGPAGLWQEIQALTARVADLESQLATANALLEDWKRAAKEHRADLKDWLTNKAPAVGGG